MRIKSEFKRIFALLLLVLLVVVVSGCSFSFEKAGQRVDETIDKGVDREEIEKKVEEVKTTSKTKFDELVKDLEAFDMKKIDQWTESNNLNEYGDAIDTIYEKGSPLVEEAGKMKDKYEYILENHPNLVDELKLDLDLTK